MDPNMPATLSALAVRDHHDASPGASTTTTTTSPDHHATGSVLADKTFTPLSVLDDSFSATSENTKTTVAAPNTLQRLTAEDSDNGDGKGMGPSDDTVAVSTHAATATSAPSAFHQGAASISSLPVEDPTKSNCCAFPALEESDNNTNGTPELAAGSTPPHNPVPLRTGSVRHDTKLAHPKPINLTTSTTSAISSEPGADLNGRLGSHVGNVAQLEATAEQLSRTSSIDHAIRDLHGELKRSDSRRSSILQARTSPDANPPASTATLKRALSNASSIVPTNIAARQGGYSPAGFIMSPSNSVSGRLRSGSKTSISDSEQGPPPVISRHGSGKASVRSVRSTKLSLAEISESEPTGLDMRAFDAADRATPIEEHVDDHRVPENNDELTGTEVFHKMLGNATPDFGGPIDLGFLPADEAQRPATANTYQDDENAFTDFDGVHYEPLDDDFDLPPIQPQEQPRSLHQRRQSYIDPMTGQQMMWYPAPVPAYLNVPQKLSAHKPQATRDVRRSQILSAMVTTDFQAEQDTAARRHSAMPGAQRRSRMPERDSWLPDPLAGHRESFVGLDQEFTEPEPVHDEGMEHGHGTTAEHLKRPPRLTDPNVAEPRMSSMPRDVLPPQLRASAYFDLPNTSAPQIEVQDGSAMATLDSILDASAKAPASAFTDHVIVGKLGNEVYGKEKKRRSQAPAAVLAVPTAPEEPKKRSSFMWLTKKKSDIGKDDDAKSKLSSAQDQHDETERRSDDDEVSMYRVDADGNRIPDSDDEEDEEDEEEEYQGAPTTLLAELQLRKQQQKQRTQHLTQAFPHGMHATLLEMDAVAEAQRKQRQNKRVNLAWEDPDAHLDQNSSDDEDVPLAIIAAKQQGAKNIMDVDRPLGLMEKREIEENEPLSKRRARLRGEEPKSFENLVKRQSMMNLSVAPAPRPGGERTPSRAGFTPEPPITPNTEEPEIEEETLGERKRRLAAKEGAGSIHLSIPNDRPVSRAFTDELLGQFAPEPEPEAKKEPEQQQPPGEETLGQRRRRLQAEKEAREREMSYSNLVGKGVEKRASRLSMADILTAYPKKEEQGQQQQAASVQRPVLKQTLTSQIADRQGAFQGGVYNNGFAGRGAPPQAQSAMNLGTYSQQAGSTFNLGSYGQQNQFQQQQQGYGMAGQYASQSGLNRQYASQMNLNGQYAGSQMNLNNYGNGMMGMQQPGMAMQGQMPMNMQMPMGPQYGGSVDRVEMWRQGIH